MTNVLAVDVLSHQQDENITNEAFFFVAWGTVTDANVQSVKMIKQGQPPIEILPMMLFEDLGNPKNWTAYFDPLGSGTYTLEVKDTHPHTATVTGLTVN